MPLIRERNNTNHGHDDLPSYWALNSIGQFAKRWVDVIEDLTQRNDIRYLTLLPWKNVFQDRDLVKKRRVWCPLCLFEMEKNNQVLYEPLIWYMKLIDYCPIHKTLLLSICPFCLKESPVIGRNSLTGFCSNCGKWLGNSKATNGQIDVTPETEYRIKLLSDLISKNNQSEEVLTKLKNDKYLLTIFHDVINETSYTTKQLAIFFLLIHLLLTDGSEVS